MYSNLCSLMFDRFEIVMFYKLRHIIIIKAKEAVVGCELVKFVMH